MPKGTKCPKKKFVVFIVIIHKIKREKILKKYLGFYLVIFYSLKSKLIIISQCFFLYEQTTHLKDIWFRHGFFELWDGSGFYISGLMQAKMFYVRQIFPKYKI